MQFIMIFHVIMKYHDGKTIDSLEPEPYSKKSLDITPIE